MKTLSDSALRRAWIAGRKKERDVQAEGCSGPKPMLPPVEVEWRIFRREHLRVTRAIARSILEARDEACPGISARICDKCGRRYTRARKG